MAVTLEMKSVGWGPVILGAVDTQQHGMIVETSGVYSP
jgi:hypothetical protein